MKHTINERWDFMYEDNSDGSKKIFGVRWEDGHEVLFKDMPVQQVEAYIKRSGIKPQRPPAN